ncbi:MAG: Ig-like domain-containing protein [Deltaproteobacteria bacterium]|nr:Ig-like domain-containing protein [Deltaproteobacteria bacterium]
MQREARNLAAFLAFLGWVACGDGDSRSPTSGQGGAGSLATASSAGGAVGSGGKTGSGGAAGAGTGGASATGGTTSAGGAGSGGFGETGGATGSGSAGGGTGGASSRGGATGTGGNTGRGGATGGRGGGGTAGACTGGASTADAGLGGAGGAGTGGAGRGGAGTGGTGTGGSTAGLPAGVTALFPAPGATNVCPDPPLRITFSGAPTLGTSGKIQVHGSSGTVVASVDMAASTITDTIGGTDLVLLRPVFVDGNAAVVYLNNQALAYGQTYYVTVDAGAVKPPGGGTLSITGSTAWRFATAAAAPGNLSTLSVALDGSGQFCSVQGATDALPANNTAAATINVAQGTYHEIMRVYKKSNITISGADRAETRIVGTNNSNQQSSNPNGAGTANRCLLSFESANGLVIENLTIKNLTPQGGSQAEALRLKSCDKCIVRNVDLWSLQDTLLWDGRVYAENCLIAGNVDYIWGTGAVYFNKCEIRTVGRSGVIVQARNAAGAYGYVFVDCKLTVDSASKDNMLARIDVSVYPGSHVAYINCQMTGVAGAGWTVTGGGSTSQLRFWEYQSTDASGNPLSTSGRTGGTQIGASQAASMRDPTVVLGGWQP